MEYPIIDNLIYALENNASWYIKYGLIPEIFYSEDNNTILVIGQHESRTQRLIYIPSGTYKLTIKANRNLSIYYRDSTERQTRIGTTNSTYTLSLSGFYSFWIYSSSGITPEDIISIEFIPENLDIYSYISNKMKLPIIKCYPLFDALISASDGQQTQEENEILRHYLTPLGIGGI